MAEDRMPNLTRDAVAARQMGMTYGQYIAWKEDQELQSRKSAALKHERLPVCTYCGKPIPKGSRGRKYCSLECAEHERERKRNEDRKRKREVARKELEGHDNV